MHPLEVEKQFLLERGAVVAVFALQQLFEPLPVDFRRVIEQGPLLVGHPVAVLAPADVLVQNPVDLSQVVEQVLLAYRPGAIFKRKILTLVLA